ncbi:unnamed protein product [Heterobilharzia americana]|nr:unnamed protein product [Heterobilharzia americana]
MVVPLEAVGNCRLDEVLAKDNEIKQLLHREITDIRSTSERLQKDLDLKTTQLEKLKNDFIFNLRLIKERDSVISKLNEHVLCLTKNIHSRDILISEIKVCLDRTQSELAEAKSSEAKLREDIEDCMRETVKRERQLLEKHGTVIDVLRKTEIEERIKLQNTINRLQSELETEQLRSAADLQDALDNAKREKERLEADNSKKLFELELRLHVAEEATDLANKSKSEYMKELSCKNELLTGLNCQLNEANKTIQSKVLEIQDLQTHLKVSKQKQVLLESARMQDEESSKLQKTELLGEIDSLKAKLEHYEQEIAVNSTRHEETISSLKCENQRLLESLDQERQQTNKALDMWKEVKTKCQHAERKSRLAQAEVIRLTDDLKQALIKPELNVQEIVQCNHKDIINQIDYLQDTCDRLENENSRLKCTINMMSEQVKQVAQLTPEMITARTTTTDEKRNQQEEIKVHSKLLSAVKQIHQSKLFGLLSMRNKSELIEDGARLLVFG